MIFAAYKKLDNQFAPSELAPIYYWMGIIRLIGAPAIGSAIFVLWRLGLLNFDPLFILIAVLPLYFCLAFAIWVASRIYNISSPFLLYFEFFVDFIAITVSIYSSGGTHTEFIFLYIITIIPATLVSFRAALGVTVFSVLASIAFAMSPYLDIASAFYDPRFGLDNEKIIHLTIFILLIVMVAFQGYMYMSRIRKANYEIMRVKDEFLFRTVHDLRSPFATIRWIVEKYSLPEYRAKYPGLEGDINLIESINVRILHLLQDLSLVVRGEQAGLVLKKDKVNISVLVRDVLQEKTGTISARRVRVNYPPPEYTPYVFADEQAIKEVLSNIIDNAIVYNKEGGEITIGHTEKGNMIITTIQDTGRGISQNDLKKLFQLYFRGDSSVDIPGTGLGLYLVKKLVEKMNGTVAIASQEGQGTTVSISLPVA